MPDWPSDGGAPPPAPGRSRAWPAVAVSAAVAVVAAVLVLAAVAVVLPRTRVPTAAGTASAAPGARNEIERLPPDQAWRSIQAAIRSARTFRMTGSLLLELPGYERWAMDLHCARNGDVSGSLTDEHGARTEVRRVGGHLYLRSHRLLRGYGPAALAALGDRWVLIPPQVQREVGQVDGQNPDAILADSPEAQIQTMLHWGLDNFVGIDPLADDQDGLLGRDPERPTPVHLRPGLTVVAGAPAVAYEQDRDYLLVAATGPPYPLEYAPIPGSGVLTGDWHMSEWNAPLRVAAPARADTVDLAQVKP
jgi:hypothetical protein